MCNASVVADEAVLDVQTIFTEEREMKRERARRKGGDRWIAKRRKSHGVW